MIFCRAYETLHSAFVRVLAASTAAPTQVCLLTQNTRIHSVPKSTATKTAVDLKQLDISSTKFVSLLRNCILCYVFTCRCFIKFCPTKQLRVSVCSTVITVCVVYVTVMTMCCSGQPAEVHKETRQARTHSKPSPAGRWRRPRPPLHALNGKHCLHGNALEAQEFRVRHHPSDMLYPGGSRRHTWYGRLLCLFSLMVNVPQCNFESVMWGV